MVSTMAQASCPLFDLPPELRVQIFELVLTPTLSKTQRYPRSSIWNRPGHDRPLETGSTALLRACRRIYDEAKKFLYQTSLTFYLTSLARRPARSLNPHAVERWKASHPVNTDLEVFAQLYILENTTALQDILDLPPLQIRSVSITIRHTDWWFWEHDAPLKLHSGWSQDSQFPATVTKFTMHLETVSRKKNEVLLITDELGRWVFRRKDSKILHWLGKDDGQTERTWTGYSTLNAQRWLRDEARPEQIDYTIISLTWGLSNSNRSISSERVQNLVIEPLASRNPISHITPEENGDAVCVDELKAANIPKGTDKDKTLELCRDYRQRNSLSSIHHASHYERDVAGRDEDEKTANVVDETEDRDDDDGEVLFEESHDGKYGGQNTFYGILYGKAHFNHYLELMQTDRQAAKLYLRTLPCECFDENGSLIPSGQGSVTRDEEWETSEDEVSDASGDEGSDGSGDDDSDG
ncbi:hypothetical protein KVT40_003265 [Elsinoe batatas]|uniref:F-box domain-containing protein n=1 Tax=Elsinoe batatas TaxID=2601811 RepID=A0A8K0PEN2_9PEZI|nr:hypothetical protein KVT40_003265 [Elsinoe batatas]